LENEQVKDVAEGLSAMGHFDDADDASSNKKDDKIISLEEEV
jgi:hypothetical protein